MFTTLRINRATFIINNVFSFLHIETSYQIKRHLLENGSYRIVSYPRYSSMNDLIKQEPRTEEKGGS